MDATERGGEARACLFCGERTDLTKIHVCPRDPMKKWREGDLPAAAFEPVPTLRDRFAMAALPALVESFDRENPHLPKTQEMVDSVARSSYRVADAMLRARQPKSFGDDLIDRVRAAGGSTDPSSPPRVSYDDGSTGGR